MVAKSRTASRFAAAVGTAPLWLASACGPDLVPSGGAGTGSASDTTSTGAADGQEFSGGADDGDPASTFSNASDDSLSSTSVDNSDSTGPTPSVACFPSEAHGDVVARHPSGLVAYDDCVGMDFFVEHRGSMLIDTPDGVNEIRDANKFGLGIFSSVGTRGCCDDDSDRTCIYVSTQAFDFSLDALLDAIDGALTNAQDLCFGVVVERVGYAEPRCDAADPDCTPLACFGNDTEYDPELGRSPTDGSAEGSCTHDAECVLNHGGGTCSSYSLPLLAGFSKCATSDFCGCVDGSCVWFTQP